MAALASAERTSSGTLVASGCTLRGLYIRSAAGAGSVILKDGGSSGTVKLTIDTPAGVGMVYMEIPRGGMLFVTDVYAALSAADGVTAFYD